MSGFIPGSAKGTAHLRELMSQREPVLAPGAYDALTARLVEQAGFPAVYMTGTPQRAAGQMVSFQDFLQVVGLPEIRELERRFASLSHDQRVSSRTSRFMGPDQERTS
jgi:2-methylisocitrate lyase-like PEP mutase family enzyme